MIRPAFALLAFLLPAALIAQTPDPTAGGDSGLPNLPPLVGSVQGDLYTSPSGSYSVTIPVMPELGGTVTDTANVVTFQDSFSTHISIAAFPQDATEKWKLETSGVKDYLADFFVRYVERDFMRDNPKAKVSPTGRFIGSILGGAFVTYITLPGGSMFYSRENQLAMNQPLPVAKRGNMIFVKNGFIYVISTELAERVTEGTAYHKTDGEEDEILRERLIDVTRKMRFTRAPDAK